MLSVSGGMYDDDDDVDDDSCVDDNRAVCYRALSAI